MDDVIKKLDELDRVVRDLTDLDERRVGLGNRLVELEHYFRRAGCQDLSQRALDAFASRYVGRVIELADGMRD